MSAPRVSIILPVHDRVALLPRAVASVLRQSENNLELIVVDDASSEDVRGTLSAFGDPRIRYLRRSLQGGPAAARNTGIAHARGRYLAFQDSDDEWLLDKLACQTRILEKASEHTDLVACAVIRHHPSHVYCHSPPDAVVRGDCTAREWVEADAKAFCQTWLVRATLLDRVGVFDESLPIWEDWDLLLRIAQCSPVFFDPQPGVVSYADGHGTSAHLGRRIDSLKRLLGKLSQQPAALQARISYQLGWFLIHAGDAAGARRALAQAFKLAPLATRAWILYLFTLMGPALVRRFLSAPPSG